MTEKDGLKPDEFRCKVCGKTAKVIRDWQRCWPCCLASTSRDTRTYPGICEPCHKIKHPKGFDLI
jgi:hypothetical protein